MAKAETALKYPALTAYKQWVWKTIRARSSAERGDDAGALQWLVDEMKRVARVELEEIGKHETISTSALSQLLGPEGKIPPPSNSMLLPAINRALGIAPPPVCDPSDELSQIVDRLRARWARATVREREALKALLARGDDDEAPVDGDRTSASRRPR